MLVLKRHSRNFTWKESAYVKHKLWKLFLSLDLILLMKKSLLYFPYINVPDSAWTTQSILYWERVGAIVPDLYIDHPSRLTLEMRKLVEVELVDQVIPSRYLHLIPRFSDAFIELLHSHPIDLNTRAQSFNRGNRVLLHFQKFGEDLLQEIVQMGIARQKNYEWYFVEDNTAKLFMMFLATTISSVAEYTPATNSVENIVQGVLDNNLMDRQNMRSSFLKDLIPYPINPDPYKLADFKEKYFRQLLHFRILLESAILEISSIENLEQRNQAYNLKVEEINFLKTDILEKLQESRLGKVVYGSMFGTVSAIAGFATSQNFIGFLGLSNAVYSALDGYKRPEIQQEFSYLALMEHKLKIKNDEL